MMKEYLYSAPGEKYIIHIQLCLEKFNLLLPVFRPTIERILNSKDAKEALRKMIIYHDLGKLTEKWQEKLKTGKELPAHAPLGAAYLWKVLPETLKEPISFAIAIHHTDRGLLGDNIERPDVQAIMDGIVDFSGRIKWVDKDKWKSIPDEFFPAGIENLTVNDLREMATGLRKWARGCSLFDQHKRRIQASLIHHLLKLCDVSAAENRKKWEEEDVDGNDLYGAWLMVENIKAYVKEANLKKRAVELQAELSRCINLLEKNYNPQKIIMFGSLANNKIKEYSDIDLVIVMETNKPFLDRIKEVLLLLCPKVGMDILVYTPKEFEKLCERKFFKEEILSKGIVIYERGSQAVD